MLLYLTSNRNIGIFDFLTKDNGMIIKKLSGEFYLKKFVIQDMRNLNHYSYVAIDLKAIKDSHNEIIEGLMAFSKMYDSRIIIFAEGSKRGDPFIEQLIEMKIFNIITSELIETIQEEIRQCVSLEGMSYQDVLRLKAKLEIDENNESQRVKYTFKGRNTKIAITGADRRMGTTTTAMNLAQYLADIGAKVCYVEANKNDHIGSLPIFYSGMKVEEHTSEKCLSYRGVKYFRIGEPFELEYDFIVFDLGHLSEDKLKVIKQSDLNVLCGTGKPYEFEYLKKARNLLSNVRYKIVMSFVSEGSMDIIKRTFENNEISVYFSVYSPELFNGDVNKKVWETIMSNFIIEI